MIIHFVPTPLHAVNLVQETRWSTESGSVALPIYVEITACAMDTVVSTLPTVTFEGESSNTCFLLEKT